jgi:hypothetical protein
MRMTETQGLTGVVKLGGNGKDCGANQKKSVASFIQRSTVLKFTTALGLHPRYRSAASVALAAYIFCLQRAGGGQVVSAGDDRAAIGKDRELVAIDR